MVKKATKETKSEVKKVTKRGRKKKNPNEGFFLIHSQSVIDTALNTKANQSDLLNLLPAQAGNENKMLVTDGSATQWVQPTVFKIRTWID